MFVQGTGYLLLIALLVGRLLVPDTAIAVTVNEPAPDFTLPSTPGKIFASANSAGNRWCCWSFTGLISPPRVRRI